MTEILHCHEECDAVKLVARLRCTVETSELSSVGSGILLYELTRSVLLHISIHQFKISDPEALFSITSSDQ